MRKPNLLFIYTDEQAAATLAAYGNSQIEMPNLNRLAEKSTVFTQAYVTQPVCTPSRSTLLTGLYPHTSGCTANNIPLSPEMKCLPEMLSDDYVTAHIGKWHLGDELFAQHGFDEWISVEDMYNSHFSEGRDKEKRSDYCEYLLERGLKPEKNRRTFSRYEACRMPEELGKPKFLAEETSRFLHDNQDNPFVLYVNFLEPHMPFFGPRDNQYNPEEIPLPGNFDAIPSESQPLKTRALAAAYYEKGHSSLPLQTPENWQRMIANYWGLCSLIDTHIGTILDTLEECGLDDNTIVVFTSDHGDMMGSHRLIAKCVMFEEALRVPLMVHLPGQTQQRKITGPVSQIDVVPTILDLMGQSTPDHLQGESLREFVLGDNADTGKDVFIEWNGPNSGIVGEANGEYHVPQSMQDQIAAEELGRAVTDPVRTVVSHEGLKLNYSPLGEHELYDLNNDPGETENLYGQASYQSQISDLISRIQAWQKQTGDTVAVR